MSTRIAVICGKRAKLWSYLKIAMCLSKTVPMTVRTVHASQTRTFASTVQDRYYDIQRRAYKSPSSIAELCSFIFFDSERLLLSPYESCREIAYKHRFAPREAVALPGKSTPRQYRNYDPTLKVLINVELLT
ncbi:hypothetical protein C8J57DRAFT_1517355 [Mycena rebaudengoi]|nr:hypothetical protein C8J57DRAFT_1517355 [Mycena rebaudengoi]